MSDTLTLEEKQAKAAALIAEVKEAAAKGGGDDGQDYEAHRKKFEQAQTLMNEVKAEKNEGERKELLTLLDAFEKQAAAPPAGDEDDGIVTSAKSRLAEIEKFNAKKGESDGSYELMQGKQRVVIKDVEKTRCGGGGGGSGGRLDVTFQTAMLAATASPNVPDGGIGGSAVASNDTNGSAGGGPGNMAFAVGKTYQVSILSPVGGGGGTNAAGTGGGAANGFTSGGSTGAAASGTGGAGTTPVRAATAQHPGRAAAESRPATWRTTAVPGPSLWD